MSFLSLYDVGVCFLYCGLEIVFIRKERIEKLTEEEFLQRLDTPEHVYYIQGCKSKLALTQKEPTIFWSLSVVHSLCTLAPLAGEQAYILSSAYAKLTHEKEE